MKQRRGQGVRSTPRTAHESDVFFAVMYNAIGPMHAKFGLWRSQPGLLSEACCLYRGLEKCGICSTESRFLLWAVSMFRGLRDAPVNNDDETRPFAMYTRQKSLITIQQPGDGGIAAWACVSSQLGQAGTSER
jgi:hypothetical protein